MRRVLAALVLAAGAARADVAAVTSQNAGALTLVDTDTLQVVASVPLPGKPAPVAVDGTRGRVLAVAVDPPRLHVFDLTGKPLADWPLDGAPFGLAIRAETGMALVTDQARNLLLEIDPMTGAELRRWPTGALPAGVAVAGDTILVADRDANAVTLIRGDSQIQIPVGEHPFGVTLRGNRGFVANVLSNSVSVIDLDSAQVIATIPTGERPYALAFAQGKGFVTNQYAASLTVFDAETFAPLGEVPTDDYPEGIAATADESRLLVANWFSDTLQVIDPATLQVTDTLDMPEGPRAFGQFIAQP